MWWFVGVCVLVHLLLLSAVFDIYFSSPIQQGMLPHKAAGVAPAKRVVLIVADGLRAESLYVPQLKNLAPFLSSTIAQKGSWGISQTQVPTESRPGHIAILAGFNEDPSAITRGWKYNPVEFDSVINQSTNAWCWGSPDIVDIFNRDNLSHIHLESYDAYMQDFAGKNVPAKLDQWVFDKVHNFFENQELKTCTDVCEDGNIFFLHLLGLDTAGHSFKPQSEIYTKTIKLVDEGLSKIVNKLDKFFNDNQTAYIFTADHGMTNWGSHGDGSAHETEVPFIAWGSGIAQNSAAQHLEQINIAPLISALIGINFPINSLGVVPLNYLNVSNQQKAYIMHANALQLSEQYISKHLHVKSSTISWLFRPFPRLREKMFFELLSDLYDVIRYKDYEPAIYRCFNAISLFKVGLKYYYDYYQTVLLLFVTTGFVGWIVLLFISIKELNTHEYLSCREQMRNYFRNMWDIPGGLIGFILVICLAPLALSIPIKYYVYLLFPIFTWSMVLSRYKNGMISIALLSTFNWKEFMYMIAFYICEIELLTFTFFKPYHLTMLFVALACRESIKKFPDFYLWIYGLFALGWCPLLVDMQTVFSYLNQIIGLALWLCYGYTLYGKLSRYSPDSKVLGFQFAMLFAAFINSLIVELTITHELGLFFVNQLISWILLSVSLICPVFISTRLHNRIISSIVALMTPYTLLSVGHESIFMFFFAQHMLNWLSMEHEKNKSMNPDLPSLQFYDTVDTEATHTHTNQRSIRQCFYLLAFIMLSYFGTGNTASINSFDPMWTRCFVTVFSPFTMAGLILVKLTIPFLIVMCTFHGILLVNQAQIRNTFLIIQLFCDIMVIQFLYLVVNEGSWLEIGMSLSRFIVVNVTTIVLLLLYQIALIFTTAKLNASRIVKKLFPERNPFNLQQHQRR